MMITSFRLYHTRSTCRYLQKSELHTQICENPWEKIELDPQVHYPQVFSGRYPVDDPHLWCSLCWLAMAMIRMMVYGW